MSWALAISLVSLLPVAAPAAEGPAPEAPPEASFSAAAEGPEGPVAAIDLWQDYVRVKRPRNRGTGLMIAAAVTYGIGVAIGVGDIATNESRGSGYYERLFIAPAMILAPIGGYLRGRDDAFVDTAVGRKKRPTKAMIAGGLALAAVGVIAGLANEGMWWQCRITEEGPYRITPPEDVFVQVNVCRSGVARLGLDVSSLMVGGGLAMGLWGLKYRKDSRKYQRAAISVMPRVQRSQVGLGIVGRF